MNVNPQDLLEIDQLAYYWSFNKSTLVRSLTWTCFDLVNKKIHRKEKREFYLMIKTILCKRSLPVKHFKKSAIKKWYLIWIFKCLVKIFYVIYTLYYMSLHFLWIFLYIWAVLKTKKFTFVVHHPFSMFLSLKKTSSF